MTKFISTFSSAQTCELTSYCSKRFWCVFFLGSFLILCLSFKKCPIKTVFFFCTTSSSLFLELLWKCRGTASKACHILSDWWMRVIFFLLILYENPWYFMEIPCFDFFKNDMQEDFFFSPVWVFAEQYFITNGKMSVVFFLTDC